MKVFVAGLVILYVFMGCRKDDKGTEPPPVMAEASVTEETVKVFPEEPEKIFPDMDLPAKVPQDDRPIEKTAYGTGSSFAQETIPLLQGKITIEKPAGVLCFMNEFHGMGWEYDENHILTINIEDETSYRRMEAEEPYFLPDGARELLETGRPLVNKNYFELLNRRNNYFLFLGYLDIIHESHAFVYYKSELIGEWGAYAETQGSEYYGVMGFCAALIVDDYVVILDLSYQDYSDVVTKKLPDYFWYSTEYKIYMWKRDAHTTRNVLFKKLMSDEYRELPRELQLLRENWEQILGSIKIK